MAEQEMHKVIVNSLSVHVAVLDEHGVIIETDRAWQQFARENGMREPVVASASITSLPAMPMVERIVTAA